MPEYTKSDHRTAHRLHKKGWGYLSISQIIGCSPTTVRKWVLKKGLKPHKVSGHTEARKAKAVADYLGDETLSVDRAAKKHKVGASALARWVRAAGKKTRSQRPPIHNRESILTDLKAGLSKSEIAKKNKCSESWVYRVQKGK